MQVMIKRGLFMGLAFSMVVLTGLRCWSGSDEKDQKEDIGNDAGRKIGKGGQAKKSLKPETAVSVTINGTVVRRGERFGLREAGGKIYALDSTARAWQFEGEDVKVMGRLDHAAGMIYIDRIDAVEPESAVA